MKTLNQRIQNFYDQSTPLWLDVWGEHMHHGYYPDGKVGTKTHAQAQLDLVEEILRWGNITAADWILDAGCGVGGSARLLAKKYTAQVLALTLSPVQAANGQRYNQEAGLENQVTIEVKDDVIYVNGAKVLGTVVASNGVVHVVDAVLLPPEK